MSLAEIIIFAIKLSIMLVVFSFGLRSTWTAAMSMFQQPGLMLRSLISMNVVMFGVAVIAALVFELDPAIKIALIALSLSPVPPILPRKQTKAGGRPDYTIGLLVAMSVLSVFVVPVGVALTGVIFGVDVAMPAARVLPIVLTSVILPLFAGILVRRFYPGLSETSADRVQQLATVILVVTLIAVLIGDWPTLASMFGTGMIPALAAFSVIGLAVGHYLGGPDENDRSVLALATGARHPAIAMAIAKLGYPNAPGVVAVVFWSLIISALVAIPYVNWRKRVLAGASMGARGMRGR